MVKYKPRSFIQANSFDEIFIGETCPYCGMRAKDLDKHISKCPKVEYNIKLAEDADSQGQWAMHPACGKSLVLITFRGLCLIENDNGRYIVAFSSLKFGKLSQLLAEIEESDLSQEEIVSLINALRIKCKDYSIIPPYPELWPGCRVEVQMGDRVGAATIKEKRGNGYTARVDGHDSNITIFHKNIIRLI